MNPVKFKGHNTVIAEDQPEYIALPAHRDTSNNEGRVTTCWKLSFMDKVRVLLWGRVWLQQLTFHEPLQPVILTVTKSDVLVDGAG